MRPCGPECLRFYAAPRALWALVLGVTLALRPGPAAAQDAREIAARRDLLDRALRERAAGRHAEALAAAQQALELQATPSVRLFVATEQGALGRHAEAFSNARVCVAEATRDAGLRSRDSILAECARLEADNARHVGFVRVYLPEGTEGVAVRVNGAPLSRALLGVPYPVEAGEARIELRRGGARLHEERADVAPRETVAMRIAPEALIARAATGGEAGSREAPARGPGVAPWALVGAGLGGAALGGVLYGAGFAMVPGDAECAEGLDATNRMSCAHPEVLAAEAGPRAVATTGLVLMVAGGVSAAAGLVWALVAPRAVASATSVERDAGSARVRPRSAERLAVEPTGSGVRVRFW